MYIYTYVGYSFLLKRKLQTETVDSKLVMYNNYGFVIIATIMIM